MTLDAQLGKLNAQVNDILTNQYRNHSQHAMVSEAQVLGEISPLLGIINTMWPMLRHSISAYETAAEEFERLPKTAKNPNVYFEKAQAFFNSLEEGIRNMGNGGDGSAQGFYDGLVGGAQPGTVHQMAIMVYDIQKATKSLIAS
ncbi:MAG: hypothetical protein NDI94_07105, partial [Candidatus Woesearchaeota archaeon]|nr:hypothetical protein [Candidatus Woesearchaeota archaeon]